MAGMSFAQLQQIAAKADVSFEVLPPGQYVGKVAKAEATQSQGGKDMIKLQFEVIGGPKAGAKLWNNLTLSPENPNAVAFFFKHLGAFGITNEVLQHEPTMAQLAGMMVDRTVNLKVGIKVYNGENRNEVQGMSAADPTTIAMSAAQVDPFAAVAAPGPAAAPVPAPPAIPTAAAPAPVAPPVPAAAPVPPVEPVPAVAPVPIPAAPPAVPPVPPVAPAVAPPAPEGALPAPPF